MLTDSPADVEPGRPQAADPAPTAADEPDTVCWRCGSPTVERHCKIVCLNCGFMRDCSDP